MIQPWTQRSICPDAILSRSIFSGPHNSAGDLGKLTGPLLFKRLSCLGTLSLSPMPVLKPCHRTGLQELPHCLRERSQPLRSRLDVGPCPHCAQKAQSPTLYAVTSASRVKFLAFQITTFGPCESVPGFMVPAQPASSGIISWKSLSLRFGTYPALLLLGSPKLGNGPTISLPFLDSAVTLSIPGRILTCVLPPQVRR